jgi:hypothetical protein
MDNPGLRPLRARIYPTWRGKSTGTASKALYEPKVEFGIGYTVVSSQRHFEPENPASRPSHEAEAVAEGEIIKIAELACPIFQGGAVNESVHP